MARTSDQLQGKEQSGSGWALQQNKKGRGTSLAVQWLKLHASAAWGTGSIPALGTKIPHALGHGQKKREREKTAPRMISEGNMTRITERKGENNREI